MKKEEYLTPELRTVLIIPRKCFNVSDTYTDSTGEEGGGSTGYGNDEEEEG